MVRICCDWTILFLHESYYLKEMVSVCVVVSALFLFMTAQLAVCESAFVECNLDCFYEKIWKIEENIDCISFDGMLYWKLTNFSLICKH